MTTVENLVRPYDPFAEADELDTKHSSYIHIRIQKRTGRKHITTVQGIPPEFDQNRLLKAFKHEFSCNGTIVKDENDAEVIQLSGDQRQNVAAFLAREGIADKSRIKIHGF